MGRKGDEMRVVQVFWIDAGGKHGWEKIDKITDWFQKEENFMVDTVGLLLAENDDFIVLAMGTSTDSVLNVTRISKNSIIRMKELKYAEPD
jgi:hypothetical protein